MCKASMCTPQFASFPPPLKCPRSCQSVSEYLENLCHAASSNKHHMLASVGNTRRMSVIRLAVAFVTAGEKFTESSVSTDAEDLAYGLHGRKRPC